MSVSTDGQLCYGIVLEEDYEFPWSDEEWDNDIEDWWVYGILGYPRADFYDDHGKKPGTTHEQVDEYYKGLWAFRKENPLPVDVVNYCSDNAPMYILAVPSSKHSNSRGFPVEIDPEQLIVAHGEKMALLEFCDTYNIERDDEPKWWLSSYWG